jgi:spore maturation protein CgeB
MLLWPRVHILNELGGHGVEFEEFDPEHYPSEDEAFSALRGLLKGRHFDLFVTTYGKKYINADVLTELRASGVPSLLFCPDNLLVPYAHLGIACHFDLVWLTARETQSMFEESGAKTIFLPYAANPEIYRGCTTGARNRVLFVGNPYGSRANMINAVAAAGVDVDLYSGAERSVGGNGRAFARHFDRMGAAFNLLRFPVGRRVLLGALKQKIYRPRNLAESSRIHRYPSLSFSGMYEAYARYAVSLSSTAARNTGVLRQPVNVVNLRSFEIPASSGVQLCAYSEELAWYFEEGREILFYRSHDELAELSRYLTSERASGDLERIRRDARARAVRDHTWTIRFAQVFSRLGIRGVPDQIRLK